MTSTPHVQQWRRRGSRQEMKGSPGEGGITSPSHLRLPACWRLPVTMGMFSPLTPPPAARPATLRPEPEKSQDAAAPRNPIERLLSPEDKVQIIIGFISAGDVDLSKWAYSPSSCLSDISPAAAPPRHPRRLSSLPPSPRLSAPLFLLPEV